MPAATDRRSPDMSSVARAAATPLAGRVTVAVAAVATTVAAAVAPEHQDRRHLDHIAYEATVGLVRDGAGLYPASVDGLAVIGARVDQARALRQPWIFELWSLLPSGWLLPLYFAVVVFGSTVLAVALVRLKPAALLVGAWAATAGVFYGIDAWLLFELWAVPLILGACLAWVRRLDWVAVACCVGAVALRETAVLLPLGFLAAALHHRRSPWPWLTGLATSAALLALHWYLAADHLDPSGRSAALLGTGSVAAVSYMTSFLVLPDALGLLLWTVGLVLLWQSRLRPSLPLALMPLTGLLVNRPYWGFLAMPLCVVALGGLPPWRDEDQPGTSRKAPSVVST